MYYYLKQSGFYFKKAHKIKMTQVSSSNKPHISENMFLINKNSYTHILFSNIVCNE